jgi:hypothetical protein
VKIPPFKVLCRMALLGNEETAENSTSSNETVPFVFLLFFLMTSNIQAALLRAFHRNGVLFTCSKCFNFVYYLDAVLALDRKREW